MEIKTIILQISIKNKKGKNMNKIINGKKYDTATATRIYGQNDADSKLTRWTTLYRKKNGKFFIVNYTRWEREHDTLEAVGEKYAREWLAENADADTYEEVFGEVEE